MAGPGQYVGCPIVLGENRNNIPVPNYATWFYWRAPTGSSNSALSTEIGITTALASSGGTIGVSAPSATNPALLTLVSGTNGNAFCYFETSTAFIYIGRTNQTIRIQFFGQDPQSPSTSHQIALGLTDQAIGSESCVSFQSPLVGNFIGFWCPGGASGFTAGWSSVTQISAALATVKPFATGDVGFHLWEFDYNQALGTVSFYYDGVLQTTHTTHIPSGLALNLVWFINNDVTGGGGISKYLNMVSVYGEEVTPPNLV